MKPAGRAGRLRFRDCMLDIGVRALERGGRPVALSPKAFTLLAVLVERRPNAVSHDELRAALWPGTISGGTTLARVVSEARAAVGDEDEEPVIRTVHRFGYAFMSWTARYRRPRPATVRSAGAVSSSRSRRART